MSKFDNTTFNLLRKRFATIGEAEDILPIGSVRFCNNFFSSPDKAKSFGVLSVCIKNSSSMNKRPAGSFFPEF